MGGKHLGDPFGLDKAILNMNRESFINLIEFAAKQKQDFSLPTWLEKPKSNVEKTELAVTAMFLSMTSWYGHCKDLLDIAKQLNHQVCSPKGFERESEALNFDFPKFSRHLKSEINHVCQ